MGREESGGYGEETKGKGRRGGRGEERGGGCECGGGSNVMHEVR